MRKTWIVAVTLALSVPVTHPVAAATDQPPPRTGLLIVDHGEPPEYNAFTYESFRAFFNHLMEMGIVPAWLKLLETGTILQDANCYGCETASEDPYLIDAWLRHHEGPAVHVPASEQLPAHHVLPGGPGLGEPDIFEHVGLGAWNEWQLMGGRSPNFDQKLAKKEAVLKRLEERWPDLPVEIGYGIDPRLDGDSQGFRPAIAALINRERVDHIVVAYHGVGFSDIMQTHMIRHEVEAIVASIDDRVTVSYSDQMGMTDEYVGAIADKVIAEVERLPRDASVAIHLSGHGLPTTTCGDYDCGSDSYHAMSKRLFDKSRAAILRRIDRPGKLGVFHLYGEGAADPDDPENKMDSPMEALAKRKESGFKYVIDIPYEFDSDSRDTLIILRRGYERPVPDWNSEFESEFRYTGMQVRITNTQFGSARKINAFYAVIDSALHGVDHDGGHDH